MCRQRLVSTCCIGLSGNVGRLRCVCRRSLTVMVAPTSQIVLAAAEHHVALCLAINATNLLALTRLAPPPSPPSSVSAPKVVPKLPIPFTTTHEECQANYRTTRCSKPSLRDFTSTPPTNRPDTPCPPLARAHTPTRRRWLRLGCLRLRVSQWCLLRQLRFAC